jgi:hypothetical protein
VLLDYIVSSDDNVDNSQRQPKEEEDEKEKENSPQQQKEQPQAQGEDLQPKNQGTQGEVVARRPEAAAEFRPFICRFSAEDLILRERIEFPKSQI